MIELWHCKSARSLRPLWTLVEMGLPHQLHCLRFPPRVHHPDYLQINPLGTVPYLRDGAVNLSESVAMCHYLASRYPSAALLVERDEPDYGAFLDWLYHSDATLTFPQTIYLRYGVFEPDERKIPQAATDYADWFAARLRKLDAHLANRQYLCAERFTIADIAIGYSLYLATEIGLGERLSANIQRYLGLLQQREAFQQACALG